MSGSRVEQIFGDRKEGDSDVPTIGSVNGRASSNLTQDALQTEYEQLYSEQERFRNSLQRSLTLLWDATEVQGLNLWQAASSLTGQSIHEQVLGMLRDKYAYEQDLDRKLDQIVPRLSFTF